MNMCPLCGQTGGDHMRDCPIGRENAHRGSLKPASNEDLASLSEVGLEDVIGAKGTKLWSVNLSLPSSNLRTAGTPVVESIHVWAATYNGALLLAHELRRDIIDAEALEVG